jgi:hypothetical protein
MNACIKTALATLLSSVSYLDPDPLGSVFNWSPGTGIRNADPDPGGIKRAKMKKKTQLKDSR